MEKYFKLHQFEQKFIEDPEKGVVICKAGYCIELRDENLADSFLGDIFYNTCIDRYFTVTGMAKVQKDADGNFTEDFVSSVGRDLACQKAHKKALNVCGNKLADLKEKTAKVAELFKNEAFRYFVARDNKAEHIEKKIADQ